MSMASALQQACAVSGRAQTCCLLSAGLPPCPAAAHPCPAAGSHGPPCDSISDVRCFPQAVNGTADCRRAARESSCSRQPGFPWRPAWPALCRRCVRPQLQGRLAARQPGIHAPCCKCSPHMQAVAVQLQQIHRQCGAGVLLPGLRAVHADPGRLLLAHPVRPAPAGAPPLRPLPQQQRAAAHAGGSAAKQCAAAHSHTGASPQAVRCRVRTHATSVVPSAGSGPCRPAPGKGTSLLRLRRANAPPASCKPPCLPHACCAAKGSLASCHFGPCLLPCAAVPDAAAGRRLLPVVQHPLLVHLRGALPQLHQVRGPGSMPSCCTAMPAPAPSAAAACGLASLAVAASQPQHRFFPTPSSVQLHGDLAGADAHAGKPTAPCLPAWARLAAQPPGHVTQPLPPCSPPWAQPEASAGSSLAPSHANKGAPPCPAPCPPCRADRHDVTGGPQHHLRAARRPRLRQPRPACLDAR